MDSNAPSILKPTVIGGVSAAVVSSIPMVSCLNVFCCALVIAGGFLAGFLYSKECARQGFAFGPGNGATVGLVAGLFYAITDSIISGLIHALGWAPDLEEMLDQMDQAGLPPEYADQMVWAIEKFGTGFSFYHFLLSLLIAAVFCTVGGVIAGMSFKVEPAPPADGMMPPPPAPMGGIREIRERPHRRHSNCCDRPGTDGRNCPPADDFAGADPEVPVSGRRESGSGLAVSSRRGGGVAPTRRRRERDPWCRRYEFRRAEIGVS